MRSVSLAAVFAVEGAPIRLRVGEQDRVTVGQARARVAAAFA